MKRGWRITLIALLPIAGALVINTMLADVNALNNPMLNVRIELGTLVLMAGGVLSIVIGSGAVLWSISERRWENNKVVINTQAAEDHQRFLQRLDHELKNPLTAIRAGLANIGDQTMTPDQQQALTSVESQVLRLSRLTSDLRKLAELETRSIVREPVNIALLLEEALLLAQEQPASEHRQLTLTLPEVPWPVPDISGDWDLLFLAFYNLMDNALKFTQPGDTVVIRAFEDGASVVVEIADTGPGIDDGELPRVWEELYRGKGARGIPGSGLGLALVRAIIERHSGQVSLRSRIGQGTVVTVRLPVQ